MADLLLQRSVVVHWLVVDVFVSSLPRDQIWMMMTTAITAILLLTLYCCC
jgi:hypothetical protein